MTMTDADLIEIGKAAVAWLSARQAWKVAETDFYHAGDIKRHDLFPIKKQARVEERKMWTILQDKACEHGKDGK